MWMLMARAPKPDMPVWPGRHCLAMLDAIAWPGLWAAVIATAPFGTGIVGRTTLAVVAFCGAHRLHLAMFRNERYWFTARRWGGPLAGLAALGAMLRLFS